MKVVIVGARDRSCVKYRDEFVKGTKDPGYLFSELRRLCQPDAALLDRIFGELIERYRSNLIIVTTGCDDGIGAMVKSTAMTNHIRCVEVVCHFFNPREQQNTRAEFAQFYMARNAFMDEIGDEYHLLVNRSRHSMVENLYDRIHAVDSTRPNVRPYAVYDDDGRIVDTNIKNDSEDDD